VLEGAERRAEDERRANGRLATALLNARDDLAEAQTEVERLRGEFAKETERANYVDSRLAARCQELDALQAVQGTGTIVEWAADISEIAGILGLTGVFMREYGFDRLRESILRLKQENRELRDHPMVELREVPSAAMRELGDEMRSRRDALVTSVASTLRAGCERDAQVRLLDFYLYRFSDVLGATTQLTAAGEAASIRRVRADVRDRVRVTTANGSYVGVVVGMRYDGRPLVRFDDDSPMHGSTIGVNDSERLEILPPPAQQPEDALARDCGAE
jgi:hypothetical protein